MAKERKDKHFLHKPVYVGGPVAIKRFIATHKKYPQEALEANIQGTVVLRYAINHKGIVTSAKVISGLGYGCDEEAIRLVKLLKFEVAKNRGVKTTFHKTVKIHFRHPKPKTTPVSPSSSFSYNYFSKPAPTKQDAKKIQPSSFEKPTKTYSYTINLNSSIDSDTSE